MPLIGCFYAFLACFGFCFLFDVRGNRLFFAPFGGALGWLAFLALAWLQNDILQYFFASAAVAVYAEIMARLQRCPATVYLLVALLPMVPGGGIFYAMRACLEGNIQQFLETGLHTLGVAGALALGILVVSSFTRIASRLVNLFQMRS